MNTTPIRFAAATTLAVAVFSTPWSLAHADQSASEKRLHYGVCAQTPGGKLFQRTELFFGLSRPGGVVAEEEFQDFVDTVVTPRFPDGLTVVSAKGQFRDATSGTPVKEDAKVLILLYPFSRSSSRAVDEIRQGYKERFDQQSVLRVDEASCTSF